MWGFETPPKIPTKWSFKQVFFNRASDPTTLKPTLADAGWYRFTPYLM
jgi:hypothetical protein